MNLEDKLRYNLDNVQTIEDETNALLTYANGVTGADDERLGDAIKSLADGYGHGGSNRSFSAYLLDTLPSEGFIISEFVPNDYPTKYGNYIRVPHSLGRIPTTVVAFAKTDEVVTNAYFMGTLVNSKFGVDSADNRTHRMGLTTLPFPLAGYQKDKLEIIISSAQLCKSAWNFCNAATAETVDIRNQAVNYADTIMQDPSGTWYLAVK